MEQKEVIVLSLGGSLIVPDEIDIEFLTDFKETLLKNTKKYKFVVVCGGGSIARKYISALKKVNKSNYFQDLAGISVTRLNARFLAYFFGEDPNWGIPHDMKHIKNLLKKNDIVFCGALRYSPEQTSDSTSVRIASFLNTPFINLTNVKGLYDSNPFENKNAKFISNATIEEFNKIVMSIPYKPGMHAPVDHTAMKIIKKEKIKTYIIGKDMKQLDNLLNKRKFVGSIIE
jgi:uridylate kinase